MCLRISRIDTIGSKSFYNYADPDTAKGDVALSEARYQITAKAIPVLELMCIS
jgi:hypothetical protein